MGHNDYKLQSNKKKDSNVIHINSANAPNADRTNRKEKTFTPAHHKQKYMNPMTIHRDAL